MEKCDAYKKYQDHVNFEDDCISQFNEMNSNIDYSASKECYIWHSELVDKAAYLNYDPWGKSPYYINFEQFTDEIHKRQSRLFEQVEKECSVEGKIGKFIPLDASEELLKAIQPEDVIEVCHGAMYNADFILAHGLDVTLPPKSRNYHGDDVDPYGLYVSNTLDVCQKFAGYGQNVLKFTTRAIHLQPPRVFWIYRDEDLENDAYKKKMDDYRKKIKDEYPDSFDPLLSENLIKLMNYGDERQALLMKNFDTDEIVKL